MTSLFGFAPWLVYWVLVGNVPFSTSVLCALAVAVGLGIVDEYRDIKNLVKVRDTFVPDPARAAEYELLYRNFRALYPALSRTGRDLNGRDSRE